MQWQKKPGDVEGNLDKHIQTIEHPGLEFKEGKRWKVKV